jgi:hypothetical protein
MNTTAEEKAKQLVGTFYDKIDDFPVECGMYCQGGYINKSGLAKECATIVVNEVISVLHDLNYSENGNRADLYGEKDWQEVKEHIKNMK